MDSSKSPFAFFTQFVRSQLKVEFTFSPPFTTCSNMKLFFFVLYSNRVWQHVVCMGLDKNNIPDEYLCEVCKPRPIDRKRAKAMQVN